MRDIQNQRQELSAGINLNRMRTTLLRSSGLTIGLVWMAFVIGCMSLATPTQVAYPTSMASCFPESVFTAEDMRARVDCHPDDYKMEINNETVVLFAFPDPLLDWVGPIFVIHVPSVSEVVLDQDGKIVFDDYKSTEGRNAIEDVLNNQELFPRLLERAKDVGR